MRTLLITGVSGFVGGQLARHALRHNLYDEVIGLSRHDPHIPGLQFIQGDITKPTSLPNLPDVDVVHAAGYAADGWDEQIDIANRQGTINVLRAFTGGRFVHISSSSVYDLGQASHLVPETAFNADLYNFYNTYGKSKAHAELAVQASETERDIAPVILRPHAIYGPGDNHLLPRVQARIKRGRLLLPDAGRHQHSLTHIKHLVKGIVLSLQQNPTTCEAYNITDLEPISLATAIRLSLPQSPHIHGIATEKLLMLSRLLPNLSEYELRQTGFERTYDISKAQRELGYAPGSFTLPKPLVFERAV